MTQAFWHGGFIRYATAFLVGVFVTLLLVGSAMRHSKRAPTNAFLLHK